MRSVVQDGEKEASVSKEEILWGRSFPIKALFGGGAFNHSPEIGAMEKEIPLLREGRVLWLFREKSS